MKDGPHSGGCDRLDLTIRHKNFTSSKGVQHEVLADVTFSLESGEVGAIFGPSGCGKTTILRIVANLDKDFDGEVRRIGGGRIGMVFQNPNLLPWRTVEDNILIVAPKINDQSLTSLLAALGLLGHRHHHPAQLSVGLARRVALARAIAVEPDLLLLDEPFVSLDAGLAANLRSQLAKLVAARSVTTLLVTHDINDAIELADRILFLSGRPAKLTANLPITLPRQRRDGAAIAALRRDFVLHGLVHEERFVQTSADETPDYRASRRNVPKARGPFPTLT